MAWNGKRRDKHGRHVVLCEIFTVFIYNAPFACRLLDVTSVSVQIGSLSTLLPSSILFRSSPYGIT